MIRATGTETAMTLQRLRFLLSCNRRHANGCWLACLLLWQVLLIKCPSETLFLGSCILEKVFQILVHSILSSSSSYPLYLLQDHEEDTVKEHPPLPEHLPCFLCTWTENSTLVSAQTPTDWATITHMSSCTTKYKQQQWCKSGNNARLNPTTNISIFIWSQIKSDDLMEKCLF